MVGPEQAVGGTSPTAQPTKGSVIYSGSEGLQLPGSVFDTTVNTPPLMTTQVFSSLTHPQLLVLELMPGCLTLETVAHSLPVHCQAHLWLLDLQLPWIMKAKGSVCPPQASLIHRHPRALNISDGLRKVHTTALISHFGHITRDPSGLSMADEVGGARAPQ